MTFSIEDNLQLKENREEEKRVEIKHQDNVLFTNERVSFQIENSSFFPTNLTKKDKFFLIF